MRGGQRLSLQQSAQASVELGIRSYIMERQGCEQTLTDKAEQTKAAFHGNRQRMKQSKAKNLPKRRDELVESGLARECETSGARETRVRGLGEEKKRHLIPVAVQYL